MTGRATGKRLGRPTAAVPFPIGKGGRKSACLEEAHLWAHAATGQADGVTVKAGAESVASPRCADFNEQSTTGHKPCGAGLRSMADVRFRTRCCRAAAAPGQGEKARFGPGTAATAVSGTSPAGPRGFRPDQARQVLTVAMVSAKVREIASPSQPVAVPCNHSPDRVARSQRSVTPSEKRWRLSGHLLGTGRKAAQGDDGGPGGADFRRLSPEPLAAGCQGRGRLHGSDAGGSGCRSAGPELRPGSDDRKARCIGSARAALRGRRGRRL